jgi:hypothetical protein
MIAVAAAIFVFLNATGLPRSDLCYNILVSDTKLERNNKEAPLSTFVEINGLGLLVRLANSDIRKFA